MFWGIIHRTILLELLKIFSLALVALTGLILLAGIISEAMKNGFGPAQILAIIPLLLPSLLPYTVPTTTLFTTCIVYGRLAADNEILALKAAGIHVLHVISPALFLGAATTVVTFVFYIDIIPQTGSMLRNLVVNDIEELLYAMLRKDNCIKHPRINYEITVKNMQGRKLIDATFMRKAPNGKGFDMIAHAKEAELRVDSTHKQILIDMRQCNILDPSTGAIAFVESKIWPTEIPPDFNGNGNKFRAMDMTWSELGEYLQKNRSDKQKISEEISLLQIQDNLNQGHDPAIRKQLENMIKDRRTRDEQIFSIQSEYHVRPAWCLGCLCFALVGCPVGIWLSKSDYLSAFISCFLPIVVIYYPTMFCMLNMSCSGKLLPWMAIYNADGLMLAAGGILFHRLTRN